MDKIMPYYHAQGRERQLAGNLHVKMRLSMLPRVLDALLEDLLRLLDELPVQIDRVGRHVGVVLAEDELRRLSVVLLHLAAVRLALLGQLLGQRAVAILVGLPGL